MPEPSPTALERRVAVLEEQVAGLVARTGPPDVASGDDAPGQDRWAETFWALEGTRARSDGASHVLWTGDVTLPDGAAAQWQQTADADALLAQDWDGPAAVVAALGHPVRLRLLQELLRGRSSAAELTEAAGTGSSGQTYHHLRQLVATGWVRQGGRGRHEVPAERVVPLLVVIGACTR
ncbi:helix-turn-helix domain-containing protein [Jannaschia sp. R86511]|uniref:helix-turn-helix domain-containing protein n=1 Tax=Jannaschia sp. R86511 TaxID=3093853 RepID=UPI0036D23B9F